MSLLAITLILVGVVLAVLIFLVWQIQKISSKNNDSANQILIDWLKQFQSTFDTNLKDVRGNLTTTQKLIGERLDKAASVISVLSRELGEMSEIGRSMKDLQEFLRSPKLRGNIGETILRKLLEEMLPKQKILLQHTFRNGETVDAGIVTEAGIIPIDSKFPMENFNKMAKAQSESEKQQHQKEFVRDIKKHIDDIARKYILPAENTMDFALMYIPSESLYYEILSNHLELDEYGYKRRVRFVSPSTLYAYLRAVMESFRGGQLAGRVREVLAILRTIQQDSEQTERSLEILTRHIKNASNSVDEVNTRYARLSRSITSAQTLEAPQKKLLEDEEDFEKPKVAA